MKFAELAIGARFRFQGKTYTKVGPLAACDAAGGQRIIPRWAVLAPDEDPAPAPASATAPEAALAAFHATCRSLLDAACPDPAAREPLLSELDAAYRRCLDALASGQTAKG